MRLTKAQRDARLRSRIIGQIARKSTLSNEQLLLLENICFITRLERLQIELCRMLCGRSIS